MADLPTGPKDAKSTVMTVEEEAIIVAFRRHTLLPLEFGRKANDPGDRLSQRTPLCRAADDPEPDPIIAAPLLAAPRLQQIARGRG